MNKYQIWNRSDLGDVVLRHKYPQHNILAAPSAVHSLPTAQVSSHQGEKVTWLGKRVIPDRKVPFTSRHVPLLLEVSISQQDGVSALGGLNAGHVLGHDVGPVQEVGDAAESLGFALQADGHVMMMTMMSTWI